MLTNGIPNTEASQTLLAHQIIGVAEQSKQFYFVGIKGKRKERFSLKRSAFRNDYSMNRGPVNLLHPGNWERMVALINKTASFLTAKLQFPQLDLRSIRD